TALLPTLVRPYMELLSRTDNLRHNVPLRFQTESCDRCQRCREITVDIVRFNKYESIRFWVCECQPAVIQLISSGLFPCAPKYPSLAVDIRMLDFVTRLFCRISPNHTAWCNTVHDYLHHQGYRLKGQDPLHRRFGNTLQWFNSLQ
ncbi:hypothetical protein K435DRAFT_627991, partial [Dendrothele bispora CBS 962.96]